MRPDVEKDLGPGRFAVRGLLALLLAAAAVLGGTQVYAASVTVASFGGVSGSFYTNPDTGQLYARNGAELKLSVTTDNTTKCVRVTDGTTQVDQTSNTAKTSWTFTSADSPQLFRAGTGDGVKTVTSTAFRSFNGQGKCTANAGETLGPVTASYVLDNTGPTVTASLSPAPNGAGWNRSNTSIAWSASDAGSGVKAGTLSPATDSVIANTPVGGVTRSSSAADNLGNTGSGFVVVKLDKTAPSINPARSPDPNAFGWNNTDVTVSFTCSDALSGIKLCTGGGSVTVTTEGANQSVSGTAVDNADNVNNAGVTGINIDKTPPELSGSPTTAPNGAGWYNGNVTIAWTASDALAGLAGAAPANSTITGEGIGLFATASIGDKASNTTTAASAKVKIDRTAPSTDATAPSGWTNTDQTVTLSANDALSGVNATYYILDGGTKKSGTSVPVSGDGVHSLEFWSEDNAGNAEGHKTVDVKVDGTSPSITHVLAPLPNTNGWNNTDVTVHFVCSDALSGIASCTADKVVSSEGRDQIVTGTATDNAGNTATDPASVSVDKTAPTVTATADRPANANGWYADDVTISFACSDALSGVDTCPGAQTLGEGEHQSVTGTATDAAGNNASDTVSAINVDKTKPALTGKATTDPNAAGWYRGDVTIAWTCSDALSGIEGACPPNSTLGGEGSDLVTGATVKDRAGNTRSAASAPVKIDRTAPTTSANVPEPLASGWYAGAVQVTLAAVDSLSGVDKTYYRVDDGAAQLYDGPFQHALRGRHTITFWSVDAAGNTEDSSAPGHSITLKIDDVKPTISGSRAPAANDFGWNNAAVDVSFFCTDAESGIAGCTDPITVASETTTDGMTVEGDAIDNAGNTNETTVGPIRIDLTKPTLTGTPTAPDNAAGWYRGDVTIAWSAQDGLSGVDPATVPANSMITGQGSGLKAGPATVKDKAGNASDPTYSTAVNIDRTPPTITGKTINDDGTARTPNLLGWFNSAVRVRYTCSDALSGIAECAGDQVLDKDGTGLSTIGGATDKADNTASATVGNIKIDSHAPETKAALVCTSKNNYCRGTSATVNITATDPPPAAGVTTSGVKEIKFRVNGGLVTTAPGSTATVNLALSGSGTAIVEYWAVDNAGNSDDKPAPNKVEIKYDTIAPTVSHTLNPDANAAGWNKSDTTVHFVAVDDSDGSGVDLATLTPDVLVSDETAGLVVNGQADDLAGNTGFDAVTVRLDKTKPTISATPSGTLGSNGWYTSPVKVTFTCADPPGANAVAGSGIAVCPAAEVLGNGTNQSVSGTAKDRADNTANTTAGPFKVDTDGPAVSVRGVAGGGVYTLGAVPSGSCAATDTGSGVDGDCSFRVSGGLANGVGTFTFTATATDLAGNVTTINGSYRVIYADTTLFWLQPINDTAHTVSSTTSVFKAGSTVPAKFRLTDASGKIVEATTAPVWLNPVRGSATTAAVDESVYSDPAETGTTFRWSASDQHYLFNWGSPKNGAGYYWRIGAKLDDGTTRTVNIGLR